MSLEVLVQFLQPELLIIVVFVWCIGLFLKKLPSFTQEWTIPFVLLLVSMIMSFLYLVFVLKQGLSPDVVIISVIQGVFIASLSVFGNETVKQIVVKRKEDLK